MKNLKKLLCLALVLTMVLCLASCGASSATEEQEETTAAESDAEETEIVTNETETTDDETAASTDEAVTLTVICGFAESVSASEMLNYFCDLVEEKSNGSITFKRYMGGTFCSLEEEFSYVSSGAADLHLLLPGTVVEEMTLWNLAGYDIGIQDSIDQFNYIYFENEETASLCQDQAAECGVKILGTLSAGTSVIGAKTEITSLEDLKGMTKGVDMGSNVWTSLGISALTVTQDDMYESLSHGIIDAASAGISSFYSNKWYEVASYLLVYNVSNCAPFFDINLDTWNSLSDAQREIIEECVEETEAYQIENLDAEIETMISEMEEAGCTVNYMSDEDMLTYLTAYLKINSEEYRVYAENTGTEDAFDTVVDAIAEYAGIDLS